MGGTVAEPERGARAFRRQHGALGSFVLMSSWVTYGPDLS